MNSSKRRERKLVEDLILKAISFGDLECVMAYENGCIFESKKMGLEFYRSNSTDSAVFPGGSIQIDRKSYIDVGFFFKLKYLNPLIKKRKKQNKIDEKEDEKRTKRYIDECRFKEDAERLKLLMEKLENTKRENN